MPARQKQPKEAFELFKIVANYKSQSFNMAKVDEKTKQLLDRALCELDVNLLREAKSRFEANYLNFNR